ncbi:helix-turn-helix transcriptional regulator [Candidatus Roizmanbacteria bacterium]|nr:helix-turn-helix transcriptional regulator [Candidatus Roizmanbacteria bacterium]
MDMFSALAEPTRRSIIEMLATKGQLPASVIYDKFPASPPAISQHLKVLREAKLVQMEKQAQKHIYKINTKSLRKLEDWANKMATMWNERFDRLDTVLQTLKITDKHYGKRK